MIASFMLDCNESARPSSSLSHRSRSLGTCSTDLHADIGRRDEYLGDGDAGVSPVDAGSSPVVGDEADVEKVANVEVVVLDLSAA